MDEELSRLRRAHEQDPSDAGARERYQAALARVARRPPQPAPTRVDDLPVIGRRVELRGPGIDSAAGERVTGSAARREWDRRGWKGGGTVSLSPGARWASLLLDDSFAVFAAPGADPATGDGWRSLVVLLEVPTRRLVALPQSGARAVAHRFLDDERLAVATGEHDPGGEFRNESWTDCSLRVWGAADGRLLSRTDVGHTVADAIEVDRAGAAVAVELARPPARALTATGRDAAGRAIEVALDWEGPREAARVRLIEDGATTVLHLFDDCHRPDPARPARSNLLKLDPAQRGPLAGVKLLADGRAAIHDVALASLDTTGEVLLVAARVQSTWTLLLLRARDGAWLGRVMLGGWSLPDPLALLPAPPGRLRFDHGRSLETSVALDPPCEGLVFP